MANKAISELPQAQNVNNQDLFVLEQSGIAKKLTAETFITEQGIIDALAEALDGHGGIQSVTLASVSGRIRTYRITFTDQSATTFQVYDGTSIDRISRTSSSGLDDVYTIFLSDGTTTFFTVHNGADGTVSEAMLNDALKNKAPAVTETTESSAIANFTDGADNMPLHNILAEINPVQDLTYGDPYPAGSGKNKLEPIGAKSVTNNGITFTSNGDGTYSVSGTSTSGSATCSLYYSKQVPIKAGTYYLNVLNNVVPSVTVGFYMFANNTRVWDVVLNTTNKQAKVTVPSDIDATALQIYVATAGTVNFTLSPVLSTDSYASTFTPYSNICPISGWTGCNVTRTGKNLIDIADKTMASEGYLFNQSFDFPSGQYALSYTSTTPTNRGAVGAVGRDGNNCSTVLSTQGNKIVCIISAPNGIASMRVYNGAASYSEIQLELGSTATTYEPYIAPTTASLSWQTEAGTVYGGTIDVATGLLTVDSVCYDGGDLTWEKISGNNYRNFIATPSVGIKYANDTTTTWSSSYKGTNNNAAKANEDCYVWANAWNPLNRIAVKDTAKVNMSAAEFKTAVTGVQFLCKLFSPISFQLTGQQLKTLLGTNNVQASTGNVTVKYPADTKMFIEKLTMPTEDDMVANQAITSGQYFMIGNSLYLALANIASGAQITIGTNAQRVSLADALNTINS